MTLAGFLMNSHGFGQKASHRVHHFNDILAVLLRTSGTGHRASVICAVELQWRIGSG